MTKARRFYESATAVEIAGNWAIQLDGRPVRTPGGVPLQVPYNKLGQAMAQEWDAQGDDINPATMPLCGLANAAIGRIASDRTVFIDQLSHYAKSDLICYWADEPEDLVSRQGEVWQPLLNWAGSALGAHLTATSGVIHVDQPAEAIQAITAKVGRLNDFELAAVTDIATSLSSVVMALAVYHGQLSAVAAYDAAMVDEHYQAEKWGEDKEALDRQRQIKVDVLATATFLELIQ